MPKNKNMIKIKDNSVRFYDEDGYELTHPDDIKDWEKRNRQLSKEQSLKKGLEVNYKLSRWAQEVIKILKEHGEMKNVDIMVELRNRGCETSANHINKFFKSKNGKRFYKEKLFGNQGYWSLKENPRKSKTASIPIMITQKMRIELGLLGYSKNEIKHLTPIEANKIISECIISSSNSERTRNQ